MLPKSKLPESVVASRRPSSRKQYCLIDLGSESDFVIDACTVQQLNTSENVVVITLGSSPLRAHIFGSQDRRTTRPSAPPVATVRHWLPFPIATDQMFLPE